LEAGHSLNRILGFIVGLLFYVFSFFWPGKEAYGFGVDNFKK
jgi:hypothetical protein